MPAAAKEKRGKVAADEGSASVFVIGREEERGLCHLEKGKKFSSTPWSR